MPSHGASYGGSGPCSASPLQQGLYSFGESPQWMPGTGVPNGFASQGMSFPVAAEHRAILPHNQTNMTPASVLARYGLDKQEEPQVMMPQPFPSPLQQWVHREFDNPEDAYAVGSPVRICHLQSSMGTLYNGMIGDIVNIHKVNNSDFTLDLLFDVRCILQLPGEDPALKDMVRDVSHVHSRVRTSLTAQNAAMHNRFVIGPAYGLDESQCIDISIAHVSLPPFIFLSRLPSDKFEPEVPMVNREAFGRHAGAERPSIVLPPVWGPPLPPPGVR